MLTLPILLLLFAAIGGSATMVAILGWLFHRLNRLESMGPERLRELHSNHETLREHLDSLQEELGLLSERLDFTEKLLEKPHDPSDPRLAPR